MKTKYTKNKDLLLGLIYLSVINIVFIKTTIELIFFQFLVFVFLLNQPATKSFLRSWLPFTLSLVVFEFLRGVADNISPFKTSTYYYIYQLESRLFGTQPASFFQTLWSNNWFLLNGSVFIYTTFFYYPMAVGLAVWLRNPILFKKYAMRLFSLSLLSVLFFIFLPTAPPWLASRQFDQSIRKLLFETPLWEATQNITFIQFMFNKNLVAAFPSLHTAWPVFASIFIKTFISKRIGLYLLIIPVLMSFSLVYTGEHFVLDVLAGWILGYAFAIKWKRSWFF